MKKLISAFLLLIIAAAFAKPAIAMTAREAAALDLTEPCGFSAEEFSAGLRGELVSLAKDFAAAEAEYGVNAVFLAALAAHESGWGRHCFLPENIFGWSGKSFASKSECVDFVASRIAEKYLSEEGRCFHGRTLSGVNRSYNGSEEWLSAVAGIMAEISRKAEKYSAENPAAEAYFFSAEQENPPEEKSCSAEPAQQLFEEPTDDENLWKCSFGSSPENTASGQGDLP